MTTVHRDELEYPVGDILMLLTSRTCIHKYTQPFVKLFDIIQYTLLIPDLIFCWYLVLVRCHMTGSKSHDL